MFLPKFGKEQFSGGKVMKKIILMSLCIFFVTSVPVFGYWVTGQVKDESGNPVSDANVYINCYKDGTSYSDTDDSNALGIYEGGWLLTNCKDGNVVVKAVKGGKSGPEPGKPVTG